MTPEIREQMAVLRAQMREQAKQTEEALRRLEASTLKLAEARRKLDCEEWAQLKAATNKLAARYSHKCQTLDK